MQTFQLPDAARETIIDANANGDRLVDGGNDVVECTVTPADDNNFRLNARVSSGIVGNFRVNGLISPSNATVDISFVPTTTGSELEQDACTGTVSTVLAGAVWIQNLRCDRMLDARSPNIACNGSGGLIFENCLK
jgi:hypothetical protein